MTSRKSGQSSGLTAQSARSKKISDSAAQESKPNEEQERDTSRVVSEEDMVRYKNYIGQRWTGVCKWFNVSKGFGFILSDYEEAKHDDVFVHQSSLQMPGFRSLGEGEAIEFTVGLGKQGLEAEKVTGIAGVEIQGHSIRPLGKKKDTMIRCYNCGRLGHHKASKCPKELSGDKKFCYRCHSSDHLIAECPNMPQKGGKQIDTESDHSNKESIPVEGTAKFGMESLSLH